MELVGEGRLSEGIVCLKLVCLFIVLGKGCDLRDKHRNCFSIQEAI